MSSSDRNARRLLSEPARDDLSLSSYAHRQTIGFIGLALPWLLLLLAGWRPTDGLIPWEPLGSLSAYYYTGAGPAFCGALTALAVFFLTYRGYDNPYGFYDRIAAVAAGVAALGAVLFPTDAPAGLPAPGWWTPPMGKLHLYFGAVLFVRFTAFCVQFRRSRAGTKKQDLSRAKRLRNLIYAICGWAIAACLVWLVVAWFGGGSIYLPEALALQFFAVSWLVKGRAYEPVAYFARQSLRRVENALGTARGERG